MRKLEDFCTRKDLLDSVLIINDIIGTLIENQNKIKESVIKLAEIDIVEKAELRKARDEETYKRFFDNCNN